MAGMREGVANHAEHLATFHQLFLIDHTVAAGYDSIPEKSRQPRREGRSKPSVHGLKATAFIKVLKRIRLNFRFPSESNATATGGMNYLRDKLALPRLDVGHSRDIRNVEARFLNNPGPVNDLG